MQAVGEAGLIGGSQHKINPGEVIQATQAEVFPYDRNLFRKEQGLTASLQRLNHLWQEIRSSQAGDTHNIIQMREAAAMVATGRWVYSSALERKETRGMHKHLDFPEIDANQQHYLVSGGLDQVWVRSEGLRIEKELVGVSS